MAPSWLVDGPEPGTTSKGAQLGRVIAFANQKGGVAKTTSTLNLAVAFAEKGHKVLIVDLDPRRVESAGGRRTGNRES